MGTTGLQMLSGSRKTPVATGNHHAGRSSRLGLVYEVFDQALVGTVDAPADQEPRP
jgi:hypothetical protein